jgi:hypothetical protein
VKPASAGGALFACVLAKFNFVVDVFTALERANQSPLAPPFWPHSVWRAISPATIGRIPVSFLEAAAADVSSSLVSLARLGLLDHAHTPAGCASGRERTQPAPQRVSAIISKARSGRRGSPACAQPAN